MTIDLDAYIRISVSLTRNSTPRPSFRLDDTTLRPSMRQCDRDDYEDTMRFIEAIIIIHTRYYWLIKGNEPMVLCSYARMLN